MGIRLARKKNPLLSNYMAHVDMHEGLKIECHILQMTDFTDEQTIDTLLIIPALTFALAKTCRRFV